MKKLILLIVFAFCCSYNLNAQNTVKGIVIHGDTEKQLSNVSVSIKKENITVFTDTKGYFVLQNLPNGKQLISISLKGYEPQNFPIILSGKSQWVVIGQHEENHWQGEIVIMG